MIIIATSINHLIVLFQNEEKEDEESEEPSD